jgi:hypothetical protein
MRLIFSIFLLFYISEILFSQQINFTSNPYAVEVVKSGENLPNPWAGGLNYAQFGNIDLDQDGISDLFIFDRTGNTITTFLVKGNADNPQYIYTDTFNLAFPQLRDWALFYDYDCDGYEDIFTYMPGGIKVFRNTTPETGALSFELITPANTPPNTPLFSNYQPNYVNLFISSVNIPALVDVDNDGDMDILTFGLWGTTVEYHRNLSMEKYGHCDSLDFEIRNYCWGYFTESLSSNSLALFDTCQYNIDNPESKQPDIIGQGLRHEGATMLGIDINGNGVKDLIIGDIEYKTLSLLTNGGTVESSSIIEQDNTFPSYDVSVNLPQFPASFYLDADNDGVKDLLVSPNATSGSNNAKSVWFYKNIGSNEVPVFNYQTNNFIQNQMIELGEGAIPSLVDLTGNGLLDLVISNHAVFEDTPPVVSRWMFLKNIGTASEPKFEIVDENFLNISQYGLGSSLAPTFADLTGNGKPDMIVGDMQGRLHYFENTSNGSSISFQLNSSLIQDTSGNLIDAGTFATPFLIDLNRNGKHDLLIGCKNGNIWHYENTGTSSQFDFSLVTDSLGGITTAQANFPHNGYSTPVVANVDGQYHLFIGSRHGNLYQYANIESQLGGSFSLTDDVTINYQGIRIYPAIADLNQDGKLDLILGNFRGGVTFSSQGDIIGDVATKKKTLTPLKIFPNPSSGNVFIKLPEENVSQVRVYTISGTLVHTSSIGGSGNLDLSKLPNGMYLVAVDTKQGIFVEKVSIIR